MTGGSGRWTAVPFERDPIITDVALLPEKVLVGLESAVDRRLLRLLSLLVVNPLLEKDLGLVAKESGCVTVVEGVSEPGVCNCCGCHICSIAFPHFPGFCEPLMDQ